MRTPVRMQVFAAGVALLTGSAFAVALLFLFSPAPNTGERIFALGSGVALSILVHVAAKAKWIDRE